MQTVKIWGENGAVTIKHGASIGRQNTGLEPATYVRDEPAPNPIWVAHLRILATKAASTRFVWRWFYPNFLPNWLNKIKVPQVVIGLFWRLRERWAKAPLQVGGTVEVKKGDTFILTAKIDLSHTRG